MEKWGLRESRGIFEVCMIPMTPSGPTPDHCVVVKARRERVSGILPTLQPRREEDGYLNWQDTMRTALGFLGSVYWKYEDRHRFANAVKDLPDEVILYWYTLCFYGHRKTAGRKAFRMLLMHLDD